MFTVAAMCERPTSRAARTSVPPDAPPAARPSTIAACVTVTSPSTPTAPRMNAASSRPRRSIPLPPEVWRNASSDPAVYVNEARDVPTSPSTPQSARAPAVPRIAATLVRPTPSVRTMVATVTTVAVRTASGTGGAPPITSGTRTFRITAIVSPRATSARIPRHPPTSTTAAANNKPSSSSHGRRQWSATATYGSPEGCPVMVTTTSSPTR